MSSKAKMLVRGSILNVANFIATLVTGFILMPFIIHSLGDKMYGLWIFIGSFLGYYGLFDFGLNSAIQRFISRSIGSKEFDEINEILNTSLYIFIIIGTFLAIVSVVLAFIVPMLVNNIEQTGTFRIIIVILGISVGSSFPMSVFSGLLTADLRSDLNRLVDFIILIIRTILIIIFLSRGYGIITLALITFLTSFLGYITKYIIVKKLYTYIRISKKYINKTKIRALFNYSVYTFIAMLGDELRYNVDNLVIVIYLGLNLVTLFSIGARLIGYFRDFIVTAIGAIVPVFSQYEGAGDYDSIREKFIFFTKISSYISILIGSGLVIFGKVFILRWMGIKYENAYIILLILIIPTIFDLMQHPGNRLLYGISKHKFYALTNIAEGVINLIISIILVKKYGIYGVALGTAIPMIITKAIIQPLYVCKTIGFKIKEFIIYLILPILVISLIVIIPLWLLFIPYIKANYLNIIELSCVGSIIFVFISFKIGFTKKEKLYFRKGLFAKSSI